MSARPLRVEKLSAEIAAAIVVASNRAGLDPCLVASIVVQESSGNPNATRYEPGYAWFWDVVKNAPFRRVTQAEVSSRFAPKDFPFLPDPDGASVRAELGISGATGEWIGQRTSLGLMQIMGAVARERGFKGPRLTDLLDPASGLEWGCKHLAALCRRFDFEDAITAYNGGPGGIGNLKILENYTRPVRQRSELFRKVGF